MVNGTTFGSFMPNYGMISWGYPMMSYPQTFNGSAFGFGFPSSGTSSADSYGTTLERMRKQEEAEYQKRLREAEAREAQEAQEKLMEEMKKEASDAFPELNADEEKILLAYLEKVCKSKGTTFKENAISTAVPAVAAVGITASLKTCAKVAEGVGEAALNIGAKASKASVVSAATKTVDGAVKTSNALTSTARVVGKWAGPVLEAGMVVYEDWDDLKYTYKHGSTSDKIKQTAQTVTVAGAAAAGFAAGAAIGTACFPGVGTAVGALIGAVCGTVGSLFAKWGARKLLGENTGAKLKREQMEKEARERAAEEQAQKMESYNGMLMDALTYAQTDEELDEATAAVLAKLQGRFVTPEQQAQAQSQAEAQPQAA